MSNNCGSKRVMTGISCGRFSVDDNFQQALYRTVGQEPFAIDGSGGIGWFEMFRCSYQKRIQSPA